MPRSFSWVGDLGSETLFSDTNSEVEYPLKGHLGPVWSFIEQAYSSDDGSALSAVRAAQRDWTFMFSLFGSSENELDALLDRWTGLLTPRSYQQILRSTRQDGSQRDFYCNYKSGFDLAEESPASGRTGNAQVRIPLTFRGGPYWVDTIAQSLSFDSTSASGSWLPVTFPYALADSTIFASQAVYNDGHVDAWPSLSILGPGNDLVLSNLTTGKSLSVNHTIDGGETLYIETDTPGRRNVFSSTGEQLLGATTGSFWSLAPGYNSISIALSGTTSSTSIDFEYRRRFNNP